MAKWIRFSADYDERRSNRQFVFHASGTEAFVRDEVADDIVKKGRGEIIPAPDDKKTTKAGKTVSIDHAG